MCGDVFNFAGMADGADIGAGSGEGTDSRGTPQSPHIRAAAGLRPGGLRFAQTSHSQLSNNGLSPSRPSTPAVVEEELGTSSEPAR